MKIKAEHYNYMKNAIREAISKEAYEEHKKYIIQEGKAKDIEKRLRWDCSYAAKLSPWVCSNLYDYANDTHIDTALKQIIKELGL